MNTAIISAEINSDDIYLLKTLLKRFEAKSIKIEKKTPVNMRLVQFREKVEALRLNKKEYMKLAKKWRENGWTLTRSQCEKLIEDHKKAFDENNPRKAMIIETHLAEINFHTLSNLLMRGKYLIALDWAKSWAENGAENWTEI